MNMSDTREFAEGLSAPEVEKLDEVLPDEKWHVWQEYLIRRTEDGVLIGVAHYLYTWGVIRGINEWGYSERWCYHSLPEAIIQATVLTSTSEPTDFIRKVGR